MWWPEVVQIENINDLLIMVFRGVKTAAWMWLSRETWCRGFGILLFVIHVFCRTHSTLI